MKNVIVINSSKRKKNTYNLILSAEKLLAENDIKVKIIHLYDFVIKDCNGCQVCLKNNSCPVKDDVSSILSELQAADGIILTSPVYMAGVSGKLKTFIDRTCVWYHRPQLVGKPILLMSTTAGGYAKEVLDYMEKAGIFWGMIPTGKIYRTARNIKDGVTQKEISSFIDSLKTSRANYKPSLKALLTYQVQKVLAMKVLPVDREYWKKQKWNNQIYYYKCRIPVHKRMIAGAFYKILDTVIKPASH